MCRLSQSAIQRQWVEHHHSGPHRLQHCPGPMPCCVFLHVAVSGLPKDSVINDTALVALDGTDFDAPVGYIPDDDVDRRPRRVLGL